MKNLVVSTVGDNSVHESWLTGKAYKNFDLFLIYYGKTRDKYYPDCEYYKEAQGFKYPLLHKHLIRETAIAYDYFWFPDDDIKASTADINLMFELMKQSQYFIAQPSLKKESPHTWPHTTTKIGKVMRETKFVEIMCPIFSLEALLTMVPHFKETKTGWGLDYLWSKLAIESNKKMGIFDIVSVEHVRAMGKGDLYSNLKKLNIDYKQELADFMKKHNLKRILQRDKKEDY